MQIHSNGCRLPYPQAGRSCGIPGVPFRSKILEAARYRFGWIHLKVSAHSQPAPGFFLEIRSDDDPTFHKEIWIGDETKAISVLEKWLEQAPFYILGQLADG